MKSKDLKGISEMYSKHSEAFVEAMFYENLVWDLEPIHKYVKKELSRHKNDDVDFNGNNIYGGLTQFLDLTLEARTYKYKEDLTKYNINLMGA